MANPKEVAEQALKVAKELTAFANLLNTIGGKSDNKPQAIVSEKPSVPIKPTKKLYDNDPNSPTYDPEPPFTVEQPPERGVDFRGKVLIRKGEIKTCMHCRQPVVRAITDITEHNLSTNSFEILDPSVEWPAKIEIDKKGGVCISCPLCGRLGLWLIGSPSKGTSDGTIVL